MEGRLRDLLLDIEDRIHQGTLGTLKVRPRGSPPAPPSREDVAAGRQLGPPTLFQVTDRHEWRAALEAGRYQPPSPEGSRATTGPDSARPKAEDGRGDG